MLRCPSCSAPVEGQAETCEYCGAPLSGLEKHAEVEWPLRSPHAEALVAIDLRCPSARPLDPVRKVLEDTFVALVTDLGPRMSLRRVELELQQRLPERLESSYRLNALRVTAFTPTWRGGPTQRQRPLFNAKRRAPSSNPKLGDDGAREELVAPQRSQRARVTSGDGGARLLLHLGLSLALAAVVGAVIAIGVWISHHLMLTILLVLTGFAAAAVVWGVRRDGDRRKLWEAHVEQRRAKRAPSQEPQPAPEPALAKPAPELSAPPAELPAPKPGVSLSVPKRQRERERS